MKPFEYHVKLFENYLRGIGLREENIPGYMGSIRNFMEHARRYGKSFAVEITREDIIRYGEYLFTRKTNRGTQVKAVTVARRLSDIRHFFLFLHRNEHILLDPMEDFEYPRFVYHGREIFTNDEMARFLDSIDLETKHGERTRAIFELLYSSALRIREVVNLNKGDVDLSQRILLVRDSKWGKDRFVPFSDVAGHYVKRYLQGERKEMARQIATKCDALFLTAYGRIDDSSIRRSFKDTLKKTGLAGKELTVHSIRHSCATHLLEAGADVRYVQELLGHESIETTVKYTHLNMENLKRAYKSAHPRENMYYEEVDGDYVDNLDRLRRDCC